MKLGEKLKAHSVSLKNAALPGKNAIETDTLWPAMEPESLKKMSL
jgi:hypothetical protein